MDATIFTGRPTSENFCVLGRGWRIWEPHLDAEISLIDDGQLSVWQVSDPARMFELSNILPKGPDSVQKGEAGRKDGDAIIVILTYGNISCQFVNSGVYRDQKLALLSTLLSETIDKVPVAGENLHLVDQVAVSIHIKLNICTAKSGRISPCAVHCLSRIFSRVCRTQLQPAQGTLHPRAHPALST